MSMVDSNKIKGLKMGLKAFIRALIQSRDLKHLSELSMTDKIPPTKQHVCKATGRLKLKNESTVYGVKINSLFDENIGNYRVLERCCQSTLVL